MRYERPAYLQSRFKRAPQKRRRAWLAAAGLPGFMPHDMIRAHIADLEAMGLPRASIARDAGCSEECLYALLRGQTEQIRTRWGTALLAVDFHPNERQGNVLAIGAIRRARALQAIGWSWPALAEHTPGVRVTAIRQMTRPWREAGFISWHSWVTIHDAYEKLSGTPGTEGRVSLVQNAARRKGWAPPLDWEGHDIDDPRVTVEPSGVETGTGLRERAQARREEIARLTDAGLSAEQIAVRMGISKRHVVRGRKAAADTVERSGGFDDESAA